MTFFVDIFSCLALAGIATFTTYAVIARTEDKRIARLYCLIKGEHLKFYFVSHTGYPNGEHVFWCGRCGYESSDEAEAREYTVTNRGYLGLLDRRFE